jgi:hypothetical protein
LGIAAAEGRAVVAVAKYEKFIINTVKDGVQ